MMDTVCNSIVTACRYIVTMSGYSEWLNCDSEWLLHGAGAPSPPVARSLTPSLTAATGARLPRLATETLQHKRSLPQD